MEQEMEKLKQQILIVDDEEVNREILKEMFRDGKYELLEADNGEDAVAKLKNNDRIVLVLLDIVMPIMDGFGVLEYMHGQDMLNDIPVILIKGEDMARPQMERVEKFVNTISAKVSVFDTKKFKLNGISEEFRGMLSPIVMRSAFQRINVHLEHCRRHPLAIRRYYRRLDY